MNEVKRYDMTIEDGAVYAKERKGSGWVTWCDYDILQQKLSATTNSLSNAQEALKSAGIEADTVQAGVMELKAQRDALAAENAAQVSSLKALAMLNNRLWQWTSRMSYNTSYVGEPEGLVKGHIREMEKILDGATKETPATDAYLNAVRAEGADKVAEYHFVRIDSLKEVSRQRYPFHKAAYSDAVSVAKLLRAGNAGKDGV